MNYKDYKRKAKLAEILDKPLEGDFLVIDNYVNYLYGLKKNYQHYDEYCETDVYFYDTDEDLVIIETELSSALVLDHNLPKHLFRDVDKMVVFLTELINKELINDTGYHYDIFVSISYSKQMYEL
jgi:hypothetical protein